MFFRIANFRRQLALLLFLSGGCGLTASDLEQARLEHERLWAQVLNTYDHHTREQPNSKEEVLTQLEMPLTVAVTPDGFAVTVPGDLAPLFGKFSFLEIEGDLKGFRQVAYVSENTNLVLPAFFQSARQWRITGSFFDGWSGQTPRLLRIDGAGEITALRLVSLEGIPRRFDPSAHSLPGADAPITEFPLRINPHDRLSIGNEMTLDTTRFFRLYLSPAKNSLPIVRQFAARGFLPGRQLFKLADELENQHGQFTPPMLAEDPTRPGYADLSLFNRITSDRFAGIDPSLRFAQSLDNLPSFMEATFPGVSNQRGTPAVEHFDAAAELAAAYIADEIADSGRTATWWEVKNEADVPYQWTFHAAPDVDSWGLLVDFHRRVADAIHGVDPEIQVGGPASAWPRFEMGQPWFKVWHNHLRFMDETAEALDFYSHHFYEVDDPFTFSARESSYDGWFQGRLENSLDMLQAHMQATGNRKPILITEYGALKGGTTQQDYWLRVSILSGMMMRFLERPDEIELAVPFLLGYMHWEPDSGVALIHKDREGRFFLTPNRHFLDLWEGLGGHYLAVQSPDPKVKVLAWNEKDTIWIAINNHSGNRLSLVPEEFLQGPAADTLVSVSVRHPTYQEGTFLFINRILADGERYVLPVTDTAVFRLQLKEPPSKLRRLQQAVVYAGTTGMLLEAGQTLTLPMMLPDEIDPRRIVRAELRLGFFDGLGKGVLPRVHWNGEQLAAPFTLPNAVSFEQLPFDLGLERFYKSNTLQIEVPAGVRRMGISHAALKVLYDSTINK
jgi:hypothetical protein